MRKKHIISCILISVLALGIAASNTAVYAVTEENDLSVKQNKNIDFSYSWDRSSDEGIAVASATSSREVVLLNNNRLFAASLFDPDLSVDNGQITIGPSILKKLSNGDNILELVSVNGTVTISVTVTGEETPEPDEEFSLYADKTEFDWDRSSGKDIIINTNSSSKEFSVKSGLVLGTSITNRSLSIDNGIITLGSGFLDRLKDGKNDLEILLKEGKLNISVNVTDSEAENEKIIKTDKTDYVWDRSEILGIAVKTNSDSRKVTVIKDGEIIASDEDNDAYIFAGIVYLTSDLLERLDDGENRLGLVFDDGTVEISVTVTDKRASSDDNALTADETVFSWERGSSNSIIIQTNSESKHFTVNKNALIIGTSLTNEALSIENGQIVMGPDFLEGLKDGENKLKLVLREGILDISITVINNSSGDSDGKNEITADETYFIWDRSEFKGITIKTNSKSMSVDVKKDGKVIFSNDDIGVFLVLGRVGITAKSLRKLDDGENKLVLEFSDGSLPVTIDVTDKKNVSKPEKKLIADKTSFTWKRGSSEGIDIKTNSRSKNASVRRNGRLSVISDKNSITIENGKVTLTPEYIEKLPDGQNELTLIFDDGEVDITVEVIGEESTGSSFGGLDNSSTTGSNTNTGLSGFVPETGNAAMAAGILLTAVSAGTVFTLAAMKRKNKKNKK